MLQTLGSLQLHGFRRVKPLLLLAFVALEGQTPRRRIAELLWPRAAQPDTSLRTALYFLRERGHFFDRDDPLHTTLPCDAAELLCQHGLDALHAYSGPFLEGVDLSDVSGEFEEWVEAQRERLTRHVQVETLAVAERLDPAQAAALAEQVFRLPGAPPADPELLRRLLRLSLPGSTLEAEVRTDLHSFATREQSTLAHTSHSRMLGRSVELDTLLGWAVQAGGAVAAISGPGGIGKSTLARELLRELRVLGHPVLHVDAEGVRHASDLIARSVGAADQKRSVPDTWAGVGKLLGERAVILLDGVDALEHLPGTLADATRALPQVRWVVTGRRSRLGLPAWQPGSAPRRGLVPQPDLGDILSLRLSGLEMPPPDAEWTEVGDSSAVQLLLREGQRIRRDFTLTPHTAPLLSSLSRRLHGHPLALALAASWLRVEDLTAVYARVLTQAATLEDADPAHGAKRGLTLVAAHSWELLSEAQQRALLRLSVCKDFDPQDAPALGVSEQELDALLEHSFLETFLPGSERQRICPALDSLTATYGPQHPDLMAAARTQHAQHYLTWFTNLSPTDPQTVNERENLRIALHTAIQGGWATPEPVYHLMSHYDDLAMPTSGTDIFQDLCDLCEEVNASNNVKAAAQIACMWLAQRANRLQDSQSMAERFLAGSLANDPLNRMKVLNTLAIVNSLKGKYLDAAYTTCIALEISKSEEQFDREAMYAMNLLDYLIRIGNFKLSRNLIDSTGNILHKSGLPFINLSLLIASLKLPNPNYANILVEGIDILKEARRLNSIHTEISTCVCLSQAYLMIGNYKQSVYFIENALDLLGYSESTQWYSELVYLYSRNLCFLGDFEKSRELIKYGLESALSRHNFDDIVEGIIHSIEFLLEDHLYDISQAASSALVDRRLGKRQRELLSVKLNYINQSMDNLQSSLHERARKIANLL